MPDFPAYYYHESGQSRVVASAAEAKGLGAGWSDQINDAAIQTIRKGVGRGGGNHRSGEPHPRRVHLTRKRSPLEEPTT
jgi:hypothetical protein